RGSKPGLDLRTDFDPLDMPAEHIRQKQVALVAGIVSDALAEQAGRHTDTRAIAAHQPILLFPPQRSAGDRRTPDLPLRRPQVTGGLMKRKHTGSLSASLESLSSAVTRWTGSTGAFAVAAGIVLAWALLGPLFRFSDTWQLVINTGTTIVTFL